MSPNGTEAAFPSGRAARRFRRALPTSYTMPKPSIRVLCVEDHRIVREGIALILSAQRDIKVVASAATGEEAVTLFRQHRPDVTLMDLQLPTMSGLDAIREIRKYD